jgi:hypothetical protein
MTDSGDLMIAPDTPPFSEAAVLTWFGLAADAAQAFETALATFTIVMRLSDDPGMTSPELRGNPFKSVEKRTLGHVLHEARRVVSFHELLDKSLQEAVNTRNYLFHHFFPMNSSRMESEEGRAIIVGELQKAITLFSSMSNALLALSEPTVRVLNMSPGELDAELERWRHVDIDL